MKLEDFEFDFSDDNSCSIVCYSGEDEKVVIPSEVEHDGKKYSVQEIGAEAFQNCESIVDVVIPESVIEIGDNSFGDCVNLKSVSLPQSLCELGGECFKGCISLKEIEIPKCVSCISGGAFMDCISLNSVKLPEDLESIQIWAFCRCRSLTHIDIPDNVSSISSYAFASCTSLTSIKIPDGIDSIEEETFDKCFKLQSVTLPDSVDYIGEKAFNRCYSLKDITLPKSLTSIGELAFHYCKSLQEIDIPENVTEIEMSAFENCFGLTRVSIPSSVEDLTNEQFRNCVNLSDLTISDETDIDESTFSMCVNLPGKCSDPIKINEDSYCTIEQITDREEIDMESYGEYSKSEIVVISVALAFKGLVTFMNKSVDEAIESINKIINPENIILAYDCDVDGDVDVNIIDDSYESKATQCSSFHFAVYKDELIDYDVYVDTKPIVAKFTEFISAMNDLLRQVLAARPLYEFSTENNPELVDIKYKDEGGNLKREEIVTFDEIPAFIFDDRDELLLEKSKSLVKNYIHLSCKKEDGECSKTSDFWYNEPNPIALYVNLQGIRYPQVIKSPQVITCISSTTSASGREMAKYAINGEGSYNKSELGAKAVALAVKKLIDEGQSIKEAVAAINDIMEINKMVIASDEEGFFDSKRCKTTDVDGTTIYVNTQWTVEKFDEFVEGMNRLICVSGKFEGHTQEEMDALVADNGVSEEAVDYSILSKSISNQNISGEAVDYSILSKSIELAFNDDGTCSINGYNGEQPDVVIPSKVINEGKTYSVTSIGESAFLKCKNLSSIVIPDSVTSIGKSAFDGCVQLSSIVIPEGVTSIGERAFWGCRNLSSIVIPDSVTSIGERAFWGCRNLSSIVIPDSVTSIGESAFEDCEKLSSIVIPEGVTSIGESAFEDCENLSSIVIPEGVTSIGERAFFNCENLSSIVIPEGVTSIGEDAFYECPSLSPSLLVYDKGTKCYGWVGDRGECKEIKIPEGVTSIRNGAFRECGNLSSIVIPEGVTSIGEYAFYDCKNLSSIVIPDSVTSIGEFAFEDCVNLKEITIPKHAIDLADYVFDGCEALDKKIIAAFKKASKK